jgi:hypothetical protein
MVRGTGEIVELRRCIVGHGRLLSALAETENKKERDAEAIVNHVSSRERPRSASLPTQVRSAAVQAGSRISSAFTRRSALSGNQKRLHRFLRWGSSGAARRGSGSTARLANTIDLSHSHRSSSDGVLMYRAICCDARSARCTRCGHKGAQLTHPSWAGLNVGFAPFPVDRL